MRGVCKIIKTKQTARVADSDVYRGFYDVSDLYMFFRVEDNAWKFRYNLRMKSG